MPSPHIDQVRQSLLDTLAELRDRNKPMDIQRAKAVAHVASVLVESAKVENEYLKITNQSHSSFLEQPTTTPRNDIPRIDGPAAHNPFPNVVRHTLKG